MKTLVIILCQAREIEYTVESLLGNLVSELNADLAYVGGPLSKDEQSVVSKHFKFQHILPEPEDWGQFLSLKDPSGGWMEVADVSPGLLGGTGYGDSVGSGAIIMWYREELRKFLSDSKLTDQYDWFMITRSDYVWPFPHPSVGDLQLDKIYFLDGERYGGLSDRYILFSKQRLEILEMATPIFTRGNKLAPTLRARGVSNPETYIAHRCSELHLDDALVFFPYFGMTIRRPGTSTRWSSGEYSRYWNLNVKYPKEAYSVLSLKFALLFNPKKNLKDLLTTRDASSRVYMCVYSIISSLGKYWPTRRLLHPLIFRRLPLKRGGSSPSEPI